jgi:hypothetical protein
MKTRKRTLLAVPGRMGIVLLLLVAALGVMPAPVTRAATFDRLRPRAASSSTGAPVQAHRRRRSALTP